MQMKKKNDVLVLNKVWIPIHIITWQRAMSLIIQDSARPMDRDLIIYDLDEWINFSNINDDYPKIKTVKYKISIPEVILLKNYDKLPLRDVKYSRVTLFERDNFKCCFCNKKFSKLELTVDHIIPRSKGGGTNWENTVSACKSCNSIKADKTLEHSGLVMHFKPKRPKWVSPISKFGPSNPCKSWEKFLDRTLVEL
jgi:5-methylcytosine-specific restriction endonuclease McrA